MSGREWAPGDVAVLTHFTGATAVAVMNDANEWQCSLGSGHPHGPGNVPPVSARRLVVIDPEDREQVERLLRAQVGSTAGCPDAVVITSAQVDRMQAALRSHVTPPKPDEPTDLSVRVVADGLVWARVADVWVSNAEGDADWSWLSSQDDFRIEVTP